MPHKMATLVPLRYRLRLCKRELNRLRITSSAIRRISTLYEACCSSLASADVWKAIFVERMSFAIVLWFRDLVFVK